MKTIIYPLFAIVLLITVCCFLSGCQKGPSFGLVFSVNNPQTETIDVYQFNGSDYSELKLTTAKETPVEFRITDISRDGKRIVIIKPSEKIIDQNLVLRKPALFFINSGDSLQEKLVLPQGITSAILSPDGNQIAFSSKGSLWIGNTNDIEGDNVKLIASTHWIVPNSITWSPDGKYIAYTKEVDWSTVSKTIDKNAFYTETDIVNLLTLGSQMLTDGSMGCFGPQWAPNGKWIAMTCKDVNNLSERLILLSPDGKKTRILFDKGGFCYSYDWSLDSRFIAYLCSDGDKRTIFYSKVDKISQKNIPISLLNNINDISDVVWTPDGNHLIMIVTCVMNPNVSPIVYSEQILMTNLDGSDQRILDNQFNNYQNLKIFETSE